MTESIARAIRAHRAQRGLTLAAAAKASGVSSAHLSRIENGERSPSIAVLLQLARAYGVPLGVLIGEEQDAADDEVSVRRASPPAPGPVTEIGYELLGSNAPRTLLQPIRVLLPAGSATRRRSHEGEEWVLVEHGRLDLEAGTATHTLRPGDSAHFSAELEHRLANRGTEPASLLLVSSVAHPAHHAPAPDAPR
ncbi:XRE family transcriptional regulator [Herbiconiux moechotypicola]|uniref:XRE family transcriptional regulator n=1 Tax=Herbiconiux moechotypicola TaxID=637393 RepID=A0ABN3D8X7_9MICO|nr:XRE family transcriptional regulator [Herbiconiux moechotypicola]MCS5728160.1 XRE family transcriptional regulator [Herbiconiux moechotypicola]